MYQHVVERFSYLLRCSFVSSRYANCPKNSFICMVIHSFLGLFIRIPACLLEHVKKLNSKFALEHELWKSNRGYSKGGSSVPRLFTIFKVGSNLNRILFSLRETILEYSKRILKVTVVLWLRNGLQHSPAIFILLRTCVYQQSGSNANNARTKDLKIRTLFK